MESIYIVVVPDIICPHSICMCTNTEVNPIWLKTISYNNRPLSQVELLTLLSVPDDFVSAPTIIDTLEEKMGNYYIPERGTIYPILHRLSADRLIQKDEGRRMRFRLTEHGALFISSIAESIDLQFQATVQFYLNIAEKLVDNDAFVSINFLESAKHTISNFNNVIENLLGKAKDRDKDEGWVNIPID